MHCLLTNVERRDNAIRAFAGVTGFKMKSEWDGRTPPILVGNDNGMNDVQRVCRAKKIPYIYLDHAYFNRKPDFTRFRVCVSNYHCTDWRDSDRQCVEKIRPWGAKGVNVVIIHPALKTASVYPVKEWLEETMVKLRNCTDRKIVLKIKGEGDLCQTLANAWAAVCYGSVGDVDAVRLGVPVFCGPYSAALPMGRTDLTEIENPVFPDRAQWLRSLAGAEWGLNEVGLAWERIRPLVAP